MKKIKYYLIDLLLFYPKLQYWWFYNKKYIRILIILWIFAYSFGCYHASLQYPTEIEINDIDWNFIEDDSNIFI